MDGNLLQIAYECYLLESKVDIGKGKFLEFLMHSYIESGELDKRPQNC
jgi:hypothetical protein